ncbi:hypothetical protein E8E13_009599 [Curvularia kusanoi]|uniref:Uncharacterized protein n=1 Tax=Curvularia kusanoi TaxID=90978 RepID=A0A9P4W8N9_CURKU|nr:hypothetical protein E8E13_009599 [Curvularia kusanoi]
MPTYHARGITVRLGSMALEETTTRNVAIRKGDVAKRQNETAEKKLLHSPYLAERRAPLDDRAESFDLNWLADVPFMQTQVDAGFSHLPDAHEGPSRPTAVQSNGPQALAVHLVLSDKSFNSGFNDKTHLKMEVLFNSQLSACSLMHITDVRMGAKSFHQVFAGYRLDFLAERPWVLLPPSVAADGGERKASGIVNSLERWNELSAALLMEARDRGTNLDGESPPSAKFIHALASMQPPPYLDSLQKPGGRTFGVVDVIITAGTGHKPTTGITYLKCPQKLRDPSYILRSSIDLSNDHDAAEVDDTRDGTYEECEEEEWDKLGRDRGDKTAFPDESPSKRRARSGIESMRGSASQRSYLDGPLAQTPILHPPNRVASQPDAIISGSGTDSRCPAPEHCSGGFKQPLPPTNRDRFYNTLGTSNEIQRAGRISSLGSHSFDASSLPSSVFRTLQPPIDRPRSNTMSSFDSMSGGSAVDIQRNQTTLPLAGSNSQSSISHMLPTSSPIFTNPNWSTGSSPWTSSYQDDLVSPSEHIQPVRQHLNSSSYGDSSALFDFLPSKYPYFGTMPPLPPLPSLTMSGPLPPTGTFSVTTKPRRSSSPVKKMKAGSFSNELVINRLVIKGRRGEAIVDRSWDVPRLVRVGQKESKRAFAGESMRAPVAKPLDIDGWTLPSDLTETSGGQSQPQPATFSSDRNPIANAAESHQKRRDSQQDPLHGPALLPYLKRHEGPAQARTQTGPWIDVPDMLAPLVLLPVSTSPASLNTLAPGVEPVRRDSHNAMASSERRNTLLRLPLPRALLPSAQGPNAATFVFDDPEEVVREAAKSRRSHSPTKPKLTVQVPATVLPAPHRLATSSSGAGDSSGLSSVPPTPIYETPATADAATPPDPPLQFDGSSERMLPSKPLPASTTPSPKKAGVASRPNPHTPLSSAASSSKKRKFSQGSQVKKPRSPGRLKTINNPPLNQDCVIAFAESANKSAEHGVLRQVKGERQGTFKEDYVVLAVRFFIGGDGDMVL